MWFLCIVALLVIVYLIYNNSEGFYPYTARKCSGYFYDECVRAPGCGWGVDWTGKGVCQRGDVHSPHTRNRWMFGSWEYGLPWPFYNPLRNTGVNQLRSDFDIYRQAYRRPPAFDSRRGVYRFYPNY